LGDGVPVAILIPTYHRAERIAAVTLNALDSTEHANVYFIVEPDDHASITAVVGTVGANLILNRRKANYAGAINTGVMDTDEPYVFAGADDLNFHHGWFEAAVALMKKPIEVVGTNDLGNPAVMRGEHATHYLVSRNYATQGVADREGIMLHEGYDHNWCDTEFIETAKWRGRFAPCLDSKVEHMHVAWGKAQMDRTYTKGFSNEGIDARLFQERSELWSTQ
jgi:hypothetical protein